MPNIQLRYSWRERQTAQDGVEIVNIEALREREFYGDLYDAGRYTSREGAQHMARNAHAIIAFADATSLHASEMFKTVFAGAGRHEPSIDEGFDHTRLWTTGKHRARKHVVTTEPYGHGHETAAVWCAERGWQCHVYPVGIGLWNPAGGARLVLCSPARDGLEIAPLIEPIEAALRAFI